MLRAPDAVLAALDPEQREVALATRGPVCVLAGAGTGKTRAITHRIAYAAAVGHLNPAHVLALTFTVRAAGEMRGRLRQLGARAGAASAPVRASTFHAAALRQLNYFWPRVVGGRPPRLVDSKAALVREAAKQAGSGWTARGWERCRRRRRDRVGQGPPGPAGRLPARGGGGPLARGRRGPGRGGVRRLRAAAPGAEPDRLRVGARTDRGHRARAPRARRSGAGQLQVLRGRRVPGREPAAEAAARRLARRPRRAVRGGRPAPGHLLLHRRHPGLPDRFRRGVPRRHGGPDGARLPLHTAGGRGGQPAGPRRRRWSRSGRRDRSRC